MVATVRPAFSSISLALLATANYYQTLGVRATSRAPVPHLSVCQARCLHGIKIRIRAKQLNVLVLCNSNIAYLRPVRRPSSLPSEGFFVFHSSFPFLPLSKFPFLVPLSFAFLLRERWAGQLIWDRSLRGLQHRHKLSKDPYKFDDE